MQAEWFACQCQSNTLSQLTDKQIFDLAADESPAALLLADHSGTVVRANAAAVEMLGRTRAEIEGTAIRAVAERGFGTRERALTDAGGGRWRLVALDANPALANYFRLASALDQIAEGLVYYGPDGRMILANKAAHAMMPEVSDLFVPGTHYTEVFRHVEDMGLAVAASREAQAALHRVAHDMQLVFGEYDFERLDGSWLRSALRPLDDGGLVHVMIAITEMKDKERALADRVLVLQDREQRLEYQRSQLSTLAEELDDARIEAERASRAKSEFLATISHELRTPLNAVIGFSQVLHSELFGALGHPRYREYALDIMQSGEHLLGLINDILDLSKAEAGHMEIEVEAIDPGILIADAVRLMAPTAQNAGVRLDTDLGAGLPEIEADRRKLKQILLNLCSNALKFTEAGGHVTVGAAALDGGWLRLSVVDTGIGMSPDDIGRALEPFVQIESSLSRTRGGTGLGLALCRKWIDLHGGRMTLESALGKGTVVHVDLPPVPVTGEDA